MKSKRTARKPRPTMLITISGATLPERTDVEQALRHLAHVSGHRFTLTVETNSQTFRRY